MKYIYQFFYFLKTYDNFVMPILFLLVVAFGLVNWLCNPYRRQNKKFAKCTEKLLHPNTCNEQSLRILPKEYQRQWRAFVRSGASKPSQTMEFVPCKNPLRFLLVIVLGGLLSVGYGVLFFEDFSNTEAAVIMKKSERQIRNLLYRAKESLRNTLEKEGFRYEGI